MKNLGNRLRDLREARNLKQTQVSEATGINNKILSSYERNTCLPTLENLTVLCKFYQISADSLLGIKENSPQKEAEIPKLKPLTPEQQRILTYYERLSDENKDAIKGLLVYYYKAQSHENPPVNPKYPAI